MASGSRTWRHSTASLLRELAAQFLAVAEKQGATALRMIGHRIAGTAFLYTGDIVEGEETRFDLALALYKTLWTLANDRSRRVLAKTWPDGRCSPLGQWLFGSLAIPRPRYADVDQPLKDEQDDRATRCASVYLAGLWHLFSRLFCRKYAAANAEVDELLALADEKAAPWRGSRSQ